MGFNVSCRYLLKHVREVDIVRYSNLNGFYRYFGRKRLLKKNEKWVGDSNQLVHASYSYWTLGYALSLRGAKKLLGK